MYVDDILDEAVEATGLNGDQPLLFKKLWRAVQRLSRLGNWDAQQLYMDIHVQQGEPILILPREVLAPIKININKNPSFSRSRLYEFSLDGPGEQDALTDWQWMDQNTVPLLSNLPSVGARLTVKGDIADAGKEITFTGLDINNNEINETIILTGADQESANIYQTMRRVRKDVTTKKVLVSLPNGDAVANYYPDETEPRYKKIKLSRRARSVHMHFKSTMTEIRGPDDYIPLDSEDAVIFMLKSNEIAKNGLSGPSEESQNWQKLAISCLQEEQVSRNAAQAAAQGDQIQPSLNLNINNRDSVIAGDVIDEVFEIYGAIGIYKAFDRITDALEALGNMNLGWDGKVGYIDLNVGWGGLITLPRYVYRPIKINFGGTPMRARNRWFEFHLNGPGSFCRGGCDTWDEMGDAVTVNDPPRPFRLVAINDYDDDEGATIRIYGYDEEGKWIRTPNPDTESDDKYVDGVILEARYANALPDDETPLFSRIERITRDETNGYQKLLAYMPDDAEPILIGYYYPDETEPKYSRIKLPNRHFGWWTQRFSGQWSWRDRWVRMRYLKRDLKVHSLTDPLNLKSRLAIVNELRALQSQKKDPTASATYEAIAKKYLQEEESAKNPAQQFSIEVEEDFGDPQHMQM